MNSTRHLVVRTDDVDVTNRDALQHEAGSLFRRPGTIRLISPPLRGEFSEDETRHNKMSCELATPLWTQTIYGRMATAAC